MSMTSQVVPIKREFPEGPAVRGFLHRAEAAGGDALVLTHGAGSNCAAPLLVGLAEEFAAAGVTVLRCDLPYRQRRLKGSPFPSGAAEDREGLRRAVALAREFTAGRIYMGGQSYGGRQATILASEAPGLVAALLLISYPLHPPGKPERLRTDHFPRLETPALFAHGSRDPFGALDEMNEALPLLPGRHRLVEFEGAGHGLVRKRQGPAAVKAVALKVAAAFQEFAAP